MAVDTVSGLVIQALRYLGRPYVDDQVIDTLKRTLSPKDRKRLLRDIPCAPKWIGDIFQKLNA